MLLLCVAVFDCGADLIAKSSVTMCENSGDGEDPFNVVDNKACEKKLIVTMSVNSGQVGSTSLIHIYLWPTSIETTILKIQSGHFENLLSNSAANPRCMNLRYFPLSPAHC